LMGFFAFDACFVLLVFLAFISRFDLSYFVMLATLNQNLKV